MKVKPILIETGELDGSIEELACPACSSAKVKIVKNYNPLRFFKNLIIVIGASIAASPVTNLYKSNTYRCTDCGRKFIKGE